MKHKYYDMIVAKAGDMDLVVFGKHDNGVWWAYSNDSGVIPAFDDEHFACLPKHKDACLHWLNGGEAEYKNLSGDFVCFGDSKSWIKTHLFMTDVPIRIKPKKEKRWIPVNTKECRTASPLFKSGSGCELWVSQQFGLYDDHPWQFIEIEIEV